MYVEQEKRRRDDDYIEQEEGRKVTLVKAGLGKIDFVLRVTQAEEEVEEGRRG